MNNIENFFKDVRKKSQPEIDRINAYWDKKTLLVHRRALFIGIILGGILGADFVAVLWYFSK